MNALSFVNTAQSLATQKNYNYDYSWLTRQQRGLEAIGPAVIKSC